MKCSIKRVKALAALALLLSVIFSLCACLPALPEGFSEEEVKAQAESVVQLLSDKDYQGVAAMFGDEMAAALDAKGLEEALGATLDKLGGYSGIKSEAVFGQDGYAVCVIVAEYEFGAAAYTISLDTDGRVCGLYMK